MWFHSHNYLEIMYCENGSFVFEVNRNEEVVFSKTLYQGECVVITDEIYHKILTPNPSCEIINIEFDVCQGKDEVCMLDIQYLLNMSEGLKRLAAEPNGFTILKGSTGFRNTLLSLIKLLAFNSETFEDRLQSRLLMYQLLANLGKINSLSEEKIGIAYMKRAHKYINSNLMSTLTVDDIAKEAGVSKSYLQRLFREHYKIQVHEYISSKRIEHAKQLLTSTQLTNEKIALLSGFNNYNQFLYAFKKACKISPGEYRNKPENTKIDYNHADRSKYSAISPKKQGQS